MQALTGKPVFTDQWGRAHVANAMPHIDLTRGVDAIVVAPATGALHRQARARRLADDLLSTLVLARDRRPRCRCWSRRR